MQMSFLEYVDLASELAFGLMIVATIISRITPTTKDDLMVKTLKGKILKVLHFLPSLGINPRTKKLEDALKEMEPEEMNEGSKDK